MSVFSQDLPGCASTCRNRSVRGSSRKASLPLRHRDALGLERDSSPAVQLSFQLTCCRQEPSEAPLDDEPPSSTSATLDLIAARTLVRITLRCLHVRWRLEDQDFGGRRNPLNQGDTSKNIQDYQDTSSQKGKRWRTEE